MSPADAMSPADVRLAKAIITDADINIRRKIGWKPTTPEADNKADGRDGREDDGVN